jgi:mono/diheme cytochrome c family protein
MRLASTVAGTGIALALWQAAAPAHAVDLARGRLLYENHCTGCHESRVHIRERHKARSADDVLGWVERWRTDLKLGWGAAEVADVAAYLDTKFYKVEKVQ